MADEFDVVIIGSGPGGYVAAIRASQLGLKAALVEKDKLGGVCGNWGCIPSKSLINQAEAFNELETLKNMGISFDLTSFDYSKVYEKSRAAAERSFKGVTYLLKKNKVEVITGKAVITGEREVTVDGARKLAAQAIVVATGSRPKEFSGISFDENQILSSTGILSLKTLPKSLIILGSGAIGMEFAFIMQTFGVSVTVVEMLPHVMPHEDADVAAVVEKSLGKKGVRFLSGTKALSLAKEQGGVSLTVEKSDKTTEVLKAEKILVAIGRVPNTADMGLERVGIKLDQGFVPVKAYLQTEIASIYAIGDIVTSPLLAHVASKEGEIAVAHIAAQLKGRSVPHESSVDPLLVPSCIYCEPQVASFGYTEELAKKKGVEYKVYSFPYQGIGKAGAIERSEGFIKILYHPQSKEILGVHIVGVQATEIIHEALVAKQMGVLPGAIAEIIHAHPTLSEGVMESFRGVEGWAVHI